MARLRRRAPDGVGCHHHPGADIGVARETRLQMMARFLKRARGFDVVLSRCGDCATALLAARGGAGKAAAGP
jgi:hypothetical protein